MSAQQQEAPLRWHLLFGALVIAFAWLAYARSLAAPFTYDDFGNIVGNPSLHWRRLAWDELSFSLVASPSPRPIANWSFGLSHWWAGLDPSAFRTVNVWIHALNGSMVYALTWRLLGRLGTSATASVGPSDRNRALAALFAGLFFVLHPLQSQAVIYVVQRMTLMATFFSLAGVLLYLVGRDARGAPRAAAWGAMLIAWGMGIASKQIAATLPIALWGIEWIFYRERSWRWARAHAVWLALPLAFMLGLALFYLGGNLFYGYDQRGFGMVERVLTQSRVLVFYLSLVLWPAASRLNLMHETAVSHSLLDPASTLLCTGLLLLLLVVGLALPLRQRMLSFAILWFFLQVAIESSVLSLMLVFEHRMYLPMVGVACALGWLLLSAPRPAQPFRVGAALVILALLLVQTLLRVEVWRDNERLWRDAVAKSPTSAEAHTNLAAVFSGSGRYAEAYAVLARAIELDESFVDARWNFAASAMALGRTEEALDHYQAAIALDPNEAMAHGGLASLLLRLGRTDEAVASAQRALELSPESRVAHILGRAYAARGDFAAALEAYGFSLRLNPGYAPAVSGTGLALQALGRAQQAEAAFVRSLELGPSAEAHAGLAALLWERGARGGALEAEAGAYLWGQRDFSRLIDWLRLAPPDALRAARPALVVVLREANARGDRELAEALAALSLDAPEAAR